MTQCFLNILNQSDLKLQSESSDSSFSSPKSSQNYPLISTINPLFPSINSDEIVALLKKDGFALGINLALSSWEEIYEFALKTLCYGNGNPELEFYYSEKGEIQAKYGKPIFRGNYLNSGLLCPAIKKLENDPKLLEIATKYLETDSVHHENQLWWSFPVESTIYERRRAAQMFHYETGHRRSLKFSFYLTNVDLCSSPHVCVKGSHIKKKLTHRLFYTGRSHPEIVNYYGYKNIVPICGKAGFGFVEDTACFHKATPPGSKDRLILELTYFPCSHFRHSN